MIIRQIQEGLSDESLTLFCFKTVCQMLLRKRQVKRRMMMMNKLDAPDCLLMDIIQFYLFNLLNI